MHSLTLPNKHVPFEQKMKFAKKIKLEDRKAKLQLNLLVTSLTRNLMTSAKKVKCPNQTKLNQTKATHDGDAFPNLKSCPQWTHDFKVHFQSIFYFHVVNASIR